MKQPNWERWEEILLVDMYYRLVDQPEKVRDECAKLSALLRQMNPDAAQTSPQYRNEKGIYMKYQNIRYLVEGVGLSRFSNLDYEIVQLYQNDKAKFESALNEIIKDI